MRKIDIYLPLKGLGIYLLIAEESQLTPYA